MISAILTDIEGTTSSISFVKDVLFPYARAALPEFLRGRRAEPGVSAQLDALATETGIDRADTDALSARLQQWVDEDRKHTVLKALQGMIWEHGYREGAFTAHVYADAVEALRRWHAAGIPLYVYSSGSIQAQKLFFEYSDWGNLLPLFQGHFDTTSGAKRERDAYRRIAGAIGIAPAAILFLSDIVEELDAARAEGMQTCLLARSGTDGHSRGHPLAERFTELDWVQR